ncbi:MAG: ATP synthase subunit I [Microthrixaceae bacterium]|nr:ATP synthase subunit I [Microthrixaceae bacterium]MCO5313460.1 ATP synthase subunit I [Microthrixaceae bacterium]
MNDPVNPLTTAVQSAPAFEIALDMAKRSWILIPVTFFVGGFWGLNGILSAGYALVLIVVNFVLAAYMLSAAGRISFALMAGAALGGYLLRLGLIFAAVMAVRNMSWVEFVPLGIMLIVTHLGLLLWELRFVSGSMAFPGLKPKPVPNRPDDPHVANAA